LRKSTFCNLPSSDAFKKKKVVIFKSLLKNQIRIYGHTDT
jgi:hypothetical protein